MIASLLLPFQTFSFPSKLESVLLTVEHPMGRNAATSLGLEEVARRYLGEAVVTGWPYSRCVTPMIIMDEHEM